MTIARWLTPNDNWVHENGLEPDIVINLPEDLTTLAEGEDPQLQAAIEFLLGRPVVGEDAGAEVMAPEVGATVEAGSTTEAGAPLP